MKIFFFLLIIIVGLISCSKIKDNISESYLDGNGFFVLNEGNFLAGNGSLSYYSYDSLKIYNNLFYSINNRPLGDVPNSMVINDDKIYILVNNSGKIEVLNKNTLESLTTISGLNSPRNMLCVDNNKAYVTSMYSDSITIINLSDNAVSGYINIHHSSESIAASGNMIFVSNWIGGNMIMVINPQNDELLDSVTVGIEPESMVVDKNGKLWVLCNGGWARENFAELDVINTGSLSIEKKYTFPTKIASPSTLQIDGTGEILYYLENGLQKMNINSSDLPIATFITQSDNYFYKLGVNPVNGDILLTDAIDFQQVGKVILYNKDGSFVSEMATDIIPSFICFELNENFGSK